MQLMMPTPMKAVRHARSASPSSERRTPGAAAIYSDLFLRGCAPILPMGTLTTIIPIFVATVYRSTVNLNASSRPSKHDPDQQKAAF
jgi:hypothetical protein